MLKNMKIAKKLIISFVLVVLISSIASVVGIVILSKTDNDYSAALVNNGFVQGDIGDFNTYLQQGSAMVRDIIMLESPAEIKDAEAKLDKCKKLTLEALELARPACTSPEELELFARIDKAAPKYDELREKAIKLGEQNKNDEALKVFRDEAHPYLEECFTAGQELMDLNSKMGDEISNNLTNQSR
ncbi:MAG: MCP four helix bundle domain-containing protein, partial [Oscillospiraceae bacterium]